MFNLKANRLIAVAENAAQRHILWVQKSVGQVIVFCPDDLMVFAKSCGMNI